MNTKATPHKWLLIGLFHSIYVRAAERPQIFLQRWWQGGQCDFWRSRTCGVNAQLETDTGLEGKWWQNCHFWVHYPFKCKAPFTLQSTKQHNPIHFNGELVICSDTSDSEHVQRRDKVQNPSNLCKWRAGATANRKEDGWAHVIVLLSAVDKHTKVGSVSNSFLFVILWKWLFSDEMNKMMCKLHLTALQYSKASSTNC